MNKLWSRRDYLKASMVATAGMAVVGLANDAYAAGQPVVRIACSRSAIVPIWNVVNHAARNGFSVKHSILFTYADQQRAVQTKQTELATTGVNMPTVIANLGIKNLRFIAGQVFGGQNIVMRKNVKVSSWKDLEGKTIGVVPGTWVYVLFLISAQEGGADLKKVKTVKVSVGATAQEALKRGDIDGFVLFAPMTDLAVVSGIGYYPEKLDVGASSLGPANGGILASTDFLADKTLATNFMKAYVASVHEMQDRAAFTKFVTQLTGIKPAVADLAFDNLYFSEMIDLPAIIGAAKLGPQFGYAKTDLSAKVPDIVDFGPLMAATGKTREQLTGTPSEARALLRR